MQKLIYTLLFLLVSQLAQAKLEIEIIQGNASALPIAVIPLQWRSADPRPETGVAEVVSSDLYRSGLFDPLDEQDMVDRPVDAESIRYGTWRLLKVDYLMIGHVTDAPDGNGYDIVYQLVDVHTQEQLISRIISVGFGDLRFGAHRVADSIYEQLTGVKGGVLDPHCVYFCCWVGSKAELPVVRGRRRRLQSAGSCGLSGTVTVSQLVTRWAAFGLCLV